MEGGLKQFASKLIITEREDLTMGQFDEMMDDIQSIYARYLKKNRGVEYVYARLWEDYYDENPDEEMIIYNLIIARKNIEEKVISNNNFICINRAVKNYENNQKQIELFFTKEDRIAIQQMCNEIKNRYHFLSTFPQ